MKECEYKFEYAKITVQWEESRVRDAANDLEHGLKKASAEIDVARAVAAKEIARLKEAHERAKHDLEKAKLYSAWKESEKENGFEH